MTYSAIMHDLTQEVIDEAVGKKKRGSRGEGPPPGVAYADSLFAGPVDVVCSMGEFTADPELLKKYSKEEKI